MPWHRTTLWLALAVLILLALGAGTAVTKAPWWDEGYFAGPAHSLAMGGPLGSHTLGSMAYRNGERFLYWSPPLYFATLAGWFRAFGFSILSMRSLSLCFGVAFLVAWFAIVRQLAGSHVAAMTALLLAVDAEVVLTAVNGRMDMMTAALGYGGIAAYLLLRERNLAAAVVTAATLTAAAAFTHPLGVMYSCSAALVALCLDRRNLKIRHVLLAACPFIAFAAGWAIYIAKAPEIFKDQWATNTDRRLGLLRNPLRLLLTDFYERYIQYFILSPRLQGLARLKSLLFVGYLAGTAGILFSRKARMSAANRVLLLMAGTHAVLLALGDNQRFWTYNIHTLPICVALLASWCCLLWREGRARPSIVCGLAGLAALQVGQLAYKMRDNSFRTIYRPMTEFVRRYPPDSRIMGVCELIFAVEDQRLSDGMRPEAYSARRPDLIVVNRGGFGYTTVYEPERYRLLFENRDYRIYGVNDGQ